MQFAEFDVDHAISPARGKDQDRYLIQDRFVGVADGATPLGPSWPSNVGAFAKTALDELAIASSSADLDMADVWRAAISATANRFSVVEPALSCGVAMARHIGTFVEVATIGDCGALILDSGGNLTRLQDTRLSELDRAVVAATGNDAQRLRLENRASMNRDSGYWIFAADGRAADHILTARLRVEDLRLLVLYTDGFYRIVDTYGFVSSDCDLLNLLQDNGAGGTIAKLRQGEETRDFTDSYARRPADDATVVMARRRTDMP